jgi:hypothetical protein
MPFPCFRACILFTLPLVSCLFQPSTSYNWSAEMLVLESPAPVSALVSSQAVLTPKQSEEAVRFNLTSISFPNRRLDHSSGSSVSSFDTPANPTCPFASSQSTVNPPRKTSLRKSRAASCPFLSPAQLPSLPPSLETFLSSCSITWPSAALVPPFPNSVASPPPSERSLLHSSTTR